MRILYWPKPVNIALIAIGALIIGGRAALMAAPTPTQIVGERVVTDWRTVTKTRTIKKLVHGHVVRVDHKVYVQVPTIIIHTDHRVIKVPAHKLPLRSAAATVAQPLVTVYVPVQGDTVYVPTTVTETVTSTVTDILTTTVSVPLDPTLYPTTGGTP